MNKIKFAVYAALSLAAWGMIIYLQNIGTLNVYTAHTQIGFFAVAAVLVYGVIGLALGLYVWKANKASELRLDDPEDPMDKTVAEVVTGK